MAERIYLDHNASSPLRPEAREAMLRVMAMPGNPSSIHAEGRALRGEIERVRASVARLVGADAEQVFFTSGATEAASWALSPGHGVREVARVWISETEHHCMRQPDMERERFIAVDRDGRADEAAWGRQFGEPHDDSATAMAVLQTANSETGVVQHVGDVLTSVRRSNALSLCDVTQSVGRASVQMAELVADYLVLSAHKIGGPKGVGALVARDADILPDALVRGGGQERNRRAGTENVVGIAGFGAAAEAALRDLDDMPRIRAMRDRLEAGLADLSVRHGGALHIFGGNAERLPNTSCFAMEGVPAQTALMSLDLDGIAVSSGSACSSGKVGSSHVLKAMGVADDVAACAIRVSFGWTNTDDDVPAFLAAYERLVARMLARAA